VNQQSNLPIIGWREWVGLPELGIERIKAKVDTGARSSSLHATGVEVFQLDGLPHARFKMHPYHRFPERFVSVQARIEEFRMVRSSSGKSTNRPVISSLVSLLGEVWPVELTLANRAEMGFRMLLGREAFRGKFIVDAGSSFYGGKPKRKKKSNKKSGPS
jgi:hypothetical protein